MNTQRISSCPVKAVVWSFLGLTALALVLTVSARAGMLDPLFVKRAIGVLIGATIVITGNFLPKVRPMSAPGSDPAKATAAERLAGWLLVLAGAVYLALFLFAPLDMARLAAPIIGLAAVAVVALNWLWLARGGRAVPVDDRDGRGRQSRELMVGALFALFYLFAAGYLSFLVDDKGARDNVTAWILVGFCVVYSIVSVGLDLRRRRGKAS